VEDVSARVAAAVVDGMLDHARTEPLLAEALISIYSDEHVPEASAVTCLSD
jgi:hypothetical protein